MYSGFISYAILSFLSISNFREDHCIGNMGGMRSQKSLNPDRGDFSKKSLQIFRKGVLHLWVHMRFWFFNEKQGNAGSATLFHLLGKCSKKKLHFDQIFIFQSVVFAGKAFLTCACCVRKVRLIFYLLINAYQ